MRKIIVILILLLIVQSCKKETKDNNKLNIITTTSMITDLVKNIGGDLVEVTGLMGSGVDPHLYKASEGDVSKLVNADLIFYNGLHLEGKLVAIFEKMKFQNIKTIPISESLDKNTLVGSDYFASNYDPHIWFSVKNWKIITTFIAETLAKEDPKNANIYKSNSDTYIVQLDSLENKLKAKIATLPKEKRILVTAHDAFSYFGKTYGFEVIGLQGLSTTTEAGVQDVQKLAHFIISKKIKAIFIESSVPKRTIEALKAAVKSKGHEVTIGGTLFSDALGTKGTKEETYIGMFEHNVNTIVNALQ